MRGSSRSGGARVSTISEPVAAGGPGRYSSTKSSSKGDGWTKRKKKKTGIARRVAPKKFHMVTVYYTDTAQQRISTVPHKYGTLYFYVES